MSQCAFILVGPDGKRWRHRCTVCHFEVRLPTDDSLKVHATCGAQVPEPLDGPGKELTDLLHSLDIAPKLGCGCEALARKMNLWGVEGCRANRKAIVARLKANSAKYGWGDVAAAAAKAVGTGLALRLNLLDQLGSLVDLAIERAALASSH